MELKFEVSRFCDNKFISKFKDYILISNNKPIITPSTYKSLYDEYMTGVMVSQAEYCSDVSQADIEYFWEVIGEDTCDMLLEEEVNQVNLLVH